MIEFLRRYQLRKAFRSYIHELGPALGKRYGVSDQYTLLQIKLTVRHLKLSVRYLRYAVALYRHEQSQDCVDLLGIDQPLLEHLRGEVAEALFHGNIQYRATHVLAMGKQAGWKGGPPPDWRANRMGMTSL
jgi:hypothetical protein